MNKTQDNIEFLDIINMMSFIMQLQGWQSNSKYHMNLNIKLDDIIDRLDRIEQKLNNIEKE